MTEIQSTLTRLGLSSPLTAAWLGRERRDGSGATLVTRSAIDGSSVGSFRVASAALIDEAVSGAGEAFETWRQVPAPIWRLPVI